MGENIDETAGLAAAVLPPDLKALVTAWAAMPGAAKAAIQALCTLPQAGAAATSRPG